MKLPLQNISKYWDVSKDFPFEVEVLMDHCHCSREDIEILENCCSEYVVIIKGNYWGYIEDVEYLIG